MHATHRNKITKKERKKGRSRNGWVAAFVIRVLGMQGGARSIVFFHLMHPPEPVDDDGPRAAVWRTKVQGQRSRSQLLSRRTGRFFTSRRSTHLAFSAPL